MARLTPAWIASLARSAGWSGEDVVIITAIALAESNQPATTPATGNTDAIGDVGLEGPLWGPSVGLLQVRSQHKAKGTGGDRDEDALHDPRFNFTAGKHLAEESAASAKTGHDQFYPWSTWKHGDYKAYLNDAKIGAGLPALDVSTLPSPGASTDTSADPTADPTAGDKDSPPYIQVSPLEPTVLGDIANVKIDNKINGVTGFAVNVGEVITDLAFDLTSDKVAEVTISMLDDGLKIAATLDPYASPVVALGGFRLVVAAKESSGGPAGTGMTVVTCRSQLVQTLRQKRDPRPFANVRRSDAVHQIVLDAELAASPLVTGAHPRDASGVVICTTDAVASDLPILAASANNGTNESDWEAMERWAQELGWWLFEANGTVFFGPPTFLVKYMPSYDIIWPKDATTEPPDNLLELPTCRQSIDDKDLGASISLKVMADFGVSMRPGMALNVDGMGGYNGVYIITGSKGSLGPTETWEITAVTPVDPTPKRVKDSAFDAAAGAAGSVRTSGSSGVEGSVNSVHGDAADRGWGVLGKQGTNSAFARANISSFSIAGRTFQMNTKVIPLFKDLITQLTAAGYNINAGSNSQDGGYNDRTIGGGLTMSNHAWGLAFDFNGDRNPQGSKGITEFNDARIHEILKRYDGLIRWGADYQNATPDPMHFEFMGTPADADRLVSVMGLK